MGKNKSVNKCPKCGSRNIQRLGFGKKGRQLMVCDICDTEFELHVADEEKGGQLRKDKYAE
ncbi:MAG: hypothetical protein R3F48_02895 [Candidatus Zixiibacteriota bacterium]